MGMTKSKCQRCKGKTWIWVDVAGVHSSNPKRMETVRTKKPCPECEGRGFHVAKSK